MKTLIKNKIIIILILQFFIFSDQVYSLALKSGLKQKKAVADMQDIVSEAELKVSLPGSVVSCEDVDNSFNLEKVKRYEAKQECVFKYPVTIVRESSLIVKALIKPIKEFFCSLMYVEAKTWRPLVGSLTKYTHLILLICTEGFWVILFPGILMLKFGAFVISFFCTIVALISFNGHYKEVKYTPYILKEDKRFIDGIKRNQGVELDSELMKIVNIFAYDTGINVEFVANTELLAKYDKKRNTIKLNIGFVTVNTDKKYKVRERYLYTVLNQLTKILDRGNLRKKYEKSENYDLQFKKDEKSIIVSEKFKIKSVEAKRYKFSLRQCDLDEGYVDDSGSKKSRMFFKLLFGIVFLLMVIFSILFFYGVAFSWSSLYFIIQGTLFIICFGAFSCICFNESYWDYKSIKLEKIFESTILERRKTVADKIKKSEKVIINPRLFEAIEQLKNQKKDLIIEFVYDSNYLVKLEKNKLKLNIGFIADVPEEEEDDLFNYLAYILFEKVGVQVSCYSKQKRLKIKERKIMIEKEEEEDKFIIADGVQRIQLQETFPIITINTAA
jgi:hypothetical protein